MKFGSNIPDTFKLGTTQVDKIMLGTQLVWQNKPRDIAGGLLRSADVAAYNDDGTAFLNPDGENTIKYYYYAVGKNKYKYPAQESGKIGLADGSFDISFQQFTLSADRVDTTVRFYSGNTYLGYFKYAKLTNTWSTGDYTAIEFYNSANTKILDIPSSDFSGTSYGNGRLTQTIDISNPSKILFIAPLTATGKYDTNIDHTYNISHPFSSADSVTLEIKRMYSTYSTGLTSAKVASAGVLFIR